MASLDNTRNCLLLAAIPLAMSIVNVNWLFTPIGSLDPWVNVGYFLHYSDPTFLNSYYKIARLSWIIPGFVAYQVFSPIVASYVLHVGCLLVSIVFFYLAVARLFGPTIAFATAACFAVFVPFHGSGGWDYQNAPAGAYYILAFYLLTAAPSSKDIRWPLIGAGAAYAAAIHAAIGFVNLAPILVVHFLVLYWHQRGQLPSWSAALRASACFLLGAILLTASLGLVNVSVGRDFLFFKILANFAFSMVRNSQGQATWWLPWSSKWYLKFGNLYYFGFVVAVLVGCACSIIIAFARKKSNPIALSLEAQFLFVGILWIVWQSVGQTALQPDYFAYPLYPPMFFALAAIAASLRRVEIPSKKATLLCAILAAVLFCSMSFPVMSVELFNLVKPHVALFLIISIAIVVGLFAMSGGQRITTAAAVFAFATVNGVWTVGSVDGSAAVNPYGFGEVCGDRAAANGALVDSHLFLTRLVPHPESMLVWWNEREQLQNGRGCTMAQRAFAASLVSSGLRYLAPPWEGMPEPEELPASSIALISGAQRIAVPTMDYRNVERLMRRYEDDGNPLEIESRQKIGTAQFNFQLYVLRSRPPTREALSTARPIRVSTMMGSSLELNRSGVMFRSSPAAWAYIGSTSLPAGCIEGGGWISADIQVTHGNVELGVLNREGKEFLVSTLVAAGDNVQTVNLRLRSLAAAGDLILRNWDERSSSQGVLQGVRIVAEHGLTPACDPDPARTRALAQGRALSLETMARASEVVTSFTASASGVAFRSAPVAWGYIGRMPLEAGCIEGGGWLAADINVTRGIVGVGVLNRKGDDFLVRAPTSIGGEVQTVFLRLDSLASAGDLVLQNWDENSSADGTLQSVRIAAEDLPTPPACTQR